jgi:spermidine synthase
VIALREQFMVPPDDARFRVIHADAAEWIAAPPPEARFDVIVVDGFDEAGLPPALSSRPFYEACRRRLLPAGVLVANVFSYDRRHGAVLDALDGAFDGRTCRLDQVAGNNHILFATAGDQGPAARLRQRLARRRTLVPGLRLALANRLCVRLILARMAWRTVFA